MATNSPYNYDLQLQELQRRQQMLEAMQSSALKPLELGPAAGGVQPKMNILSALAPMLQALMANKAGADLKTERAAMADRYQSDLRSGMEDYFNTSQGQTKSFDMPAGVGPEAAAAGADAPVPFVPGQNTVQTPGGGTEVTAPNPRKAMLDAIASNHPVLQQLGMSQLQNMGKNSITAKDLLPYADPKSIPGMAGGDVSGFKPKREIKETGGTFYDVSGDKPTPMGGQEFGQPVVIGGDLYQTDARTGKLVKLDNAPKTTVSVGGPTILTKGQSKLAEERAVAANKDLTQAETMAAGAQQALSTVQKMRQTNQTYSGPTAGAAVWMGQLAQSMGVSVDERKLANSETFESESARMWINMMEQAGGGRGLVKEESDRIARAVPKLIHTPQGREQLFAMVEARAAETAQLMRAKQKAMARAAEADNPNLYFEELNNLGGATTPPVPAKLPSGGVRRYNPATGRIE